MRQLLRLLPAGLVALAVGAGVLSLVGGATRLPSGGRGVPVIAVLIGWGFVALAGVAGWRRPGHRIALLFYAFGLTVLVSALNIAQAPALYLLSTVADALAIAVFAHLVLAFPGGSLPDRASRAVTGGFYA